jgi:hypothetical protein
MGLAAYSVFTYSLSSSPLEWMHSIAVLFALFIALSTIESRIVRQVVCASFCVLFAVCCVLFTNLHPIF